MFEDRKEIRNSENHLRHIFIENVNKKYELQLRARDLKYFLHSDIIRTLLSDLAVKTGPFIRSVP
jgi:hypothetical protein